MITSALHTTWPLDLKIKDLESADLLAPSVIRMKLFTLDRRIIFKKVGELGQKDRLNMTKNLKLLLSGRC